MHRLTIIVLTFGLLTACGGQSERFVNEVLNSHTPIKSQGRSQLCWAYAMLSTIETEHIMRGDSVHLSIAYVEHCLRQDTLAPKSLRGMAITLVRIIGQYGLVPFYAMPDTATPAPRWAFMLGAEYTPLEFAHSVCAPDEYVALTSTDDHPYGEEIMLALPDNWTHEKFLNLHPDSLLNITKNAVTSGHGVCWEGDIGDLGFDWEQGVARLTLLSSIQEVSDDHCMAIIGLAHDEDGQPFFIMKNSWGEDNARGGLLYMSFDYFRRNTISVVLPRNLLTTSSYCSP
jgi:bleomycin hydrolase